MRLRQPGKEYHQTYEIQRNAELERADRENFKRNRDVEIGEGRVIIRSPDGTRWEITVDNSGVVGATSL